MTQRPTTAEGALDHRIDTGRLILRLFTEADYDALFQIVRDPETFRFSERGPMESEEAWLRLLRNIGHWSVKGYGLFAVEEKESGHIVGEVGLAHFRREFGSPFDDAPEASWTMAPAVQGRGYATEAMKATLGWAEEKLGIHRTVCLIHSENQPSLKVAKKIAYEPYGHREYKGYPVSLLQREG